MQASEVVNGRERERERREREKGEREERERVGQKAKHDTCVY